MKTFVIETYPNMFTDYENGIENEDYDTTIRVFSVPYQWALDFIKDNMGISINEFLEIYDWDDTFYIYDHAISQGKVLCEHIENRGCAE